ncbi:hypothetical protein CpipJ_CPIJ006033 [Culex quinquefasciatus]|uniref:Uncharacterized protein n=1 Tax=Culex quinquefasciatus TaxID=7176 RepID=B0WF92_CULQU|nr:hypothetical protein CpipJ_CPIJ006033 [Culex quinquefasciatus]|eukprot:XP_001847376.1 hypothetical protein CpipJ_CPIJ006033 [Culex quinquefasciatus]
MFRRHEWRRKKQRGKRAEPVWKKLQTTPKVHSKLSRTKLSSPRNPKNRST